MKIQTSQLHVWSIEQYSSLYKILNKFNPFLPRKKSEVKVNYDSKSSDLFILGDDSWNKNQK